MTGPRRRIGFRLGIVGFLLVPMMLGFAVLGAAPASADPLPVVGTVSLPADAVGTGAATGAGTTTVMEACAASGPVVALCGGSFLGGYWLGKNVFGPALFHLFGWGAHADNRTVMQGGWACAPSCAPTGSLTTDQAGSWLVGDLPAGQQLQLWVTCTKAGVSTRFAGGFTSNSPAPNSGLYFGFAGRCQDDPFSSVTGTACRSTWALLCLPTAASGYTITRVQVQTPGPIANGSTWGPYIAPTTTLKDWFPDPAPNAPLTITYTETCKVGSATATATRTLTGVVPTVNGQAPFPSDMPTCDSILPGSHLDQLGATTNRGTGTPDVTVTLPTFDPATKSAYPGCTDNVDTAHPCLLDLRRDGVSCVYGAAQCQGWTAYESHMSCFWGSYAVPIKWCEDQWRTAFDGVTATDPSASASVTPAGAGFPTTGTKTATDPTVSIPPVPSTANCLGGVWSWNPWDWVFTPVKCVLVWAFVPDEGQLSALADSIKGAFGGTVIGSWWSGINGLIPGIGGGVDGGCDGIPVHLDLGSMTKDFTLLRACDEPMKTAASISYDFTTFIVVVLGGIAALRGISMGFGFELGFADKARGFIGNSAFR
jgi:hypothetical protein